MLPRARFSRSISLGANVIGGVDQCLRTCSSPVGVISWITGRFIAHSMPSRDGSACVARTTVTDHACRISATGSQQIPWSTGTAPPGSRAAIAALECVPRPRARRRYTMVPECLTGADARGDVAARTSLGASAMTAVISLAPLLERFFTQRLLQERRVSPHTISSYRDTFRLLLKFVQQRRHKPPSALTFEEINAPLVIAFLDHLEHGRGLSVRSRNLRLTAIHSFFRYVAFELPTHSAQIQRVLAIPSKRFTRTLVRFLTRPEVDALLAAPDPGSWFGRRD